MASRNVGRCLDILRTLPRIHISNVKSHPGARKRTTRGRGDDGGNTHGCGMKRNRNNHCLPAGYESGNNPFFNRFRNQSFYLAPRNRVSYTPITLLKLQNQVDLSLLRTDLPIDLTQLALTGVYKIDFDKTKAGFLLEEEGADLFEAKMNLEVQRAENEYVIAAIERAGGTITTAYYDYISLYTALNPKSFFQGGKAIPKRMLPPQDMIDYYSDAKTRGYLANPDEIAEERLKLAQKYGYSLPDDSSSVKEMLLTQKDPRQIFHGLEPGWVVNLKDKVILKPTDPTLKEYYAS